MMESAGTQDKFIVTKRLVVFLVVTTSVIIAGSFLFEPTSNSKEVYFHDNQINKDLDEDVVDVTESSETVHGMKDQRPAVAVCYVGHIRSFHDPLLRANHLTRIFKPLESLGYRIDLFMLFGRGECYRIRRCRTTKISNLDLYESKKIFDWWSRAGFIPHESLFDEEKHVWRRDKVTNFTMERCGKPKTFHISIVNQFARLRRCFEDIEAEEEATGVKFKSVLKLRPDIYFYREVGADDLRKAMTKSNSTVFVPSSYLVGNRGALNDWASICRRDSCEEYLLFEKKFELCENKFCCYGVMNPLHPSYVRTNITYVESIGLFPITLARTADHKMVEPKYRYTRNKTVLACGRLRSHEAELAMCLKDQKALFDVMEGGPTNDIGPKKSM